MSKVRFSYLVLWPQVGVLHHLRMISKIWLISRTIIDRVKLKCSEKTCPDAILFTRNSIWMTLGQYGLVVRICRPVTWAMARPSLMVANRMFSGWNYDLINDVTTVNSTSQPITVVDLYLLSKSGLERSDYLIHILTFNIPDILRVTMSGLE
jgi:hypothetical protein